MEHYEQLWRRQWHPTPVFLPGESQGLGSLVGCHLWGCTESDMTEATLAAAAAADHNHCDIGSDHTFTDFVKIS